MLDRLSLRARLVLGVIVLATVGLAAADAATYVSLRSFLYDRTDSSLFGAHRAAEQTLFPGGPDGGPGRPDRGDIQALAAAAPGDFVQVRLADGSIFEEGALDASSRTSQQPPKLPAKITFSRKEEDSGDRFSLSTVGSRSGHDRYRVRASTSPATNGLVLIVAAPLRDVDSTLHRLLLIELLVTVLVLAAIGALGLWVVRLGLRPLAAIAATASKIADGDLTQRVERAEPRTEVGRLGMALNAMLGQIETAFRAQEASERKLRRFVADASHELRTPLAAVRAYAELFARGASSRPDDLARSMTGITRESERMSLLVDDLLLLARLDEGRALEREPVELDGVVAEAVETAKAVDPAREIALTSESAVVLGDRARLRQIVDNPVANVRAHTPPDTPVRVSVARENGNATIAVVDSGPGLGAEQAAHVFERFYRADTSRTRASGGAGLGLSIVAAVAEAHGGTVSANGTPGEGATFRIVLPLASD